MYWDKMSIEHVLVMSMYKPSISRTLKVQYLLIVFYSQPYKSCLLHVEYILNCSTTRNGLPINGWFCVFKVHSICFMLYVVFLSQLPVFPTRRSHQAERLYQKYNYEHVTNQTAKFIKRSVKFIKDPNCYFKMPSKFTACTFRSVLVFISGNKPMWLKIV